jgi:hypothetical protein
VREHGGLQREVGVFVVGVAGGSCKGALEDGLGTENCGCLLLRCVDDRGIRLERVLEREVDHLDLLVRHE